MSYPPLSTICRVVTEHFKVSRPEFESRRHHKALARCRHVAVYLCIKLTSRSIAQIGRYVHRNHSSIIKGNRKIKQALLDDVDLATEVNQLEMKILACSGLGAVNYEGTTNEQATMDANVLGGLPPRHGAFYDH